MTLVIATLTALALLAWPTHNRHLQALARHTQTTQNTAPPVGADALAGTVLLLAMTLRSGKGVIESLEAVGTRQHDAIGAHLLSVASALRWGVPDREAWAALPEAWTPVARAFLLARRAGVAPADLLLRVADDLRQAEQARLELATAKLAVRVVLPLGLAFLPAFIFTTVVPIVIAITGDVLSH
ncbi:Flp pilus assembly protein TadB [Dermatophilus congolensis]|uniref:Flp pilus assembly protein TadB n=2 Tax=Dermatophilus congolensis TaxID=1863 RepID=A0A239VAH6_9MICO|nr:type II secretion system F family protein [Dermatophilus congolensis]SNV19130.1 Flp pilus assembly protein TadB [Dermatophilus congolensis]